MEYRDGPPPEFQFSIVEHMWLGLPHSDLTMSFDTSDEGRYRADQLLACADRLLARTMQQRDVSVHDYHLRRLQLDRKETIAREVLKRVAMFVSCDAEEVTQYLIAVTDDPEQD